MDLCEKVVDEEENLVCGKRATSTVTVRAHFGTVKVKLCPEHTTEHNRKAASTRVRIKSK
jgi:hypothetical protein